MRGIEQSALPAVVLAKITTTYTVFDFPSGLKSYLCIGRICKDTCFDVTCSGYVPLMAEESVDTSVFMSICERSVYHIIIQY